MANRKISELASVLNAAIGANSAFPVVDSADGTTKKILLSQLDLRWALVASLGNTLNRVVLTDADGKLKTDASLTGLIKLTNGVLSTFPTLGVADGGLGLTSVAAGEILYGSGTNTYGKLPGAPSGAYLRSQGNTSAPVWYEPIQPTVQRFLSGSGTYNRPAGCIRIRVRMLGAGGGGGGNSTTQGAFPGGAGGNTTFGTRTAGGGQGGSAALGGTGGTVSGSGYTIVNSVSGADGARTGLNPSTANGTQLPGGMGGSSFFGGAGRNGAAGDPGGAAVANSGSGGGGGGCDNTASQWGGGGGGAGAYLEFIIANPASSYPYSVGAGGAGSTGAVRNGGPGGSGIIIVEEFYQ
jgi:hypothetical protein